MEFEGKLLEREEVAKGILAVRFERPAGYAFRSGQWCILHLPDIGLRDDRGLRRPLSLAGSPAEAGLLFATKGGESAFKRTLAQLPLGSPARFDSPKGNLALPEDPAAPLVFVAGGVGITPFRSMMRHAAETATGHRITLFYSSSTPEEAAFLDDLLDLCRAHPTLRVVPTMTRLQESKRNWVGATGRLNPEMIRRGCPEWEEAVYFLAGPPPMVESVQAGLAELQVPANRIRRELFSGY